MKIYKTQSEVEADIHNGVLAIEGDVKFECSISISAKIIVTAGNINAWDINAGNIIARNIIARNITAWDINAREINAWDINAWDINAWDIIAWDINAGNINAGNITAWDINAREINAGDINAGDINAGDINAGNIIAENITAGDIFYYTFCCVYQNIKCLSIKAKRHIAKDPICLDGKLEIKSQDTEVENAIKVLTDKGLLVDGKIIKI